jgi:hypothetical protein
MARPRGRVGGHTGGRSRVAWVMLSSALSRPSAEPETDLGDGVAPPIAMCVACGLTLCACAPRPAPAVSSLAWEDLGQPWWTRLWRTAVATSLEPQRFFGELPHGDVTAALAFAACAEVFALGSLAVPVAFALCWLAPELTTQLLADPAAWGMLGLTWVAFVLCMLALHGLWGACLNWGAQRPAAGPRQRSPWARTSWRSGVRFGLYACGWDLLTSPIGMLVTLLARGPRRAWAPIGAAVRAPGLAQRAYLERCLGADAAAQRSARRLSVLVLSGGMLLVIALFVTSLLSLAWHFGY